MMMTCIVDISNMTHSQISHILKTEASPLFLSTHKTFNYFRKTGRLPALPPHATWRALCVPQETRKGSMRAVFDVEAQTFVPEPRKSPTRVSYTSPGKCSIVTSAKATTKASHHWCELDDRVMGRMAHRFGLPLYTNDVALGRSVQRATPLALSSIDESLLKRTKQVDLRFLGGRYVIAK